MRRTKAVKILAKYLESKLPPQTPESLEAEASKLLDVVEEKIGMLPPTRSGGSSFCLDDREWS